MEKVSISEKFNKKTIVIVMVVILVALAFFGSKMFIYNSLVKEANQVGIEVADTDLYVTFFEISKLNNRIEIYYDGQNYETYYNEVALPVVTLQNANCQEVEFDSKDEAIKIAKASNLELVEPVKCLDGGFSFTYETSEGKFWANGKKYEIPPVYDKNKEY